jgi:DNA-binding transcriptional LysR family regulator
MNVSSKQLRGFCMAAQLGSFTKAAEKLHLTQAGLSALVRALESQVGGRLFERTTRSLSLTEAGERMLPVAERVLAELDAASTDVLGIAIRRQRVLRVGATPLVASRLLPAVCAALRRQDPEVTVQIVEIQRDPIQEQVLHGELDMGLGIFLAPRAGLTRRKLFSSRLYAVSSAAGTKNDEGRDETSVRWNSLRGVPLVTLQPANPVQQLIDRYLPMPRDAPRASRYAVNHIETQIAMAEIGTGTAVIPSFALPACRSYRVDIRALRDPVVELDFYGITRSGSGANQLAGRFADVLAGISRTMLERRAAETS